VQQTQRLGGIAGSAQGRQAIIAHLLIGLGLSSFKGAVLLCQFFLGVLQLPLEIHGLVPGFLRKHLGALLKQLIAPAKVLDGVVKVCGFNRGPRDGAVGLGAQRMQFLFPGLEAALQFHKSQVLLAKTARRLRLRVARHAEIGFQRCMCLGARPQLRAQLLHFAPVALHQGLQLRLLRLPCWVGGDRVRLLFAFAVVSGQVIAMPP
jgi:hypothetical protein